MKFIKSTLIIFSLLFVFPKLIHPQTLNNISNKGEKKAISIFGKMLDVYTKSNSLSYTSHLIFEKNGVKKKEAIYKVKLKKGNFSFIEASSIDGKYQTNLIQHGDTLYLNWPTGFRWYDGDDSVEANRIKHISYMRFIADSGKQSIGHRIEYGGVGIAYLAQLNPSYFHGYVNELFRNIDTIKFNGEETINGEKCYIIEVNIYSKQRKFLYWISQTDYFPRKLVQELQLSYKNITTEYLSDIKINPVLNPRTFSWSPPHNWIEQKEPTLENNVLTKGTIAPNFELIDLKGNHISLNKLHGKVVLLNFWRIGCPPCRVEAPFLEKLHQENKDNDLTIISLNFFDKKKLVEQFIDEFKLTFTNIVDTSKTANLIFNKKYQNKSYIMAWPLNYIIDKEGKIVVGWYGFDPNNKNKHFTILNKLLD